MKQIIEQYITKYESELQRYLDDFTLINRKNRIIILQGNLKLLKTLLKTEPVSCQTINNNGDIGEQSNIDANDKDLSI